MKRESESKRGLNFKAQDIILNAGMMFPTPSDPKWKELWDSHRDIVLREFGESGKEDQERTMQVLLRSNREPMPDLGPEPIDWDTELAEFSDLPYPAYYLLPIHSALGGWLSQSAAMNNRRAMEAIYQDSHPQKCCGMRTELAKFVPEDARVVVDLGAGDGDGSAAIVRLRPAVRVLAVEASPFMIIVGRRQNRDVDIEWRHSLAEATGLESDSVDCVTITLVFHECSDEGKNSIIREAFRVLRPGGTLIFSDTPPANLTTYRGFYEPWKDQWLKFDVDQFLGAAGFVDLQAFDVTAPAEQGGFQVTPTGERLFTRVARKPAAKL